MPLLRAFAAGQGQSTTVRWVPLLSLTAFALGTLGLYLRTPGMRQEGSLRPTQQGIPLAKDAWMVGIGLALMIDEVAGRANRS